MRDDIIYCEELQSNSETARPKHPYLDTILNKIVNQSGINQKRRIGSARELFKNNNPQDLETWMDIFDSREKFDFKEIVELVKSKRSLYGLDLSRYTDEVVEDYLHNFLYDQTFTGFYNERLIFQVIAEKEGYTYQFSDDMVDSKGIDGYINGHPVQIKPCTAKSKNHYLNDDIKVIFYDSEKKEIYYDKQYLDS